MQQPFSQFLEQDVLRLIHRDYPALRQGAIAGRLGVFKSPQVRLALLTLAQGDERELSQLIELAQQDERDVLVAAEYLTTA